MTPDKHRKFKDARNWATHNQRLLNALLHLLATPRSSPALFSQLHNVLNWRRLIPVPERRRLCINAMRGRGTGHERWGPLWNKEVRPGACVCGTRMASHYPMTFHSLTTHIPTLAVVEAFLCSSFLEGICWRMHLGESCDQEGVGLDLPKEPAMSQIPSPSNKTWHHA